MNRTQINHLLQAISVMAKPDIIVVLGKGAAVLRLDENAPNWASDEIALEVHLPNFETKGFSFESGFDHQPGQRTDQAIDEVLGQQTYFNQQFGYHTETVRDWQIEFPEGWTERATKIETKGLSTILYPSLVDACAIDLSRIGKEEPDHDIGWVEALVASGQVDAASLYERMSDPDGAVWVRFAGLTTSATDPVVAERFRLMAPIDDDYEGEDPEV